MPGSIFSAGNARGYIDLVSDMFRRVHKHAIFVADDRSAGVIVEFDKRETDHSRIKSAIDPMRYRPGYYYDKNRLPPRWTQLGIDSEAAAAAIERSAQGNQLTKWLDLLEPVSFVSESLENLRRQTMYMNVLSMYARDQEGNGVYVYQMQILQALFDKDENIPLKFGCGKVGNVLRPFVYFNRPKSMDLGAFIEANPTLGEIQDNFNMQ